MHLRYDEDFVEAAVFLCASGRRKGIASLQIARFERQREKLYSILDTDERNDAFFQLHLEWFREWGFEELLNQSLLEFPLLSRELKLLAFRKALGRHDEGAELYVNEAGDRHGVVAIYPERWEAGSQLQLFLRHELAHLNDMVDPAFGYTPGLAVAGPSLNQHRLARERYRSVWDIVIDGRLTRSGRATIATREQRWSEFSALFAFWSEARQSQVFESLWLNPSPTHQILAELACDPRQLQSSSGPGAGAPCPLCGFPTFAWADPAVLTNDIAAIVRSEFPLWAPEHGACSRCFKIFRLKQAASPLAV